MKLTENRLIYNVTLVLLTISLSDIEIARYSVYALPPMLLILWLASPNRKLHFQKEIWPFLLLILVGTLSILALGPSAIKKTYFIVVYTSIFVLFDFSKLGIDMRHLLVVLIIAMALRLVFAPESIDFWGKESYSLVDSISSFESTLSFSFGLLAIIFIQRRQMVWAVISILLVFLSLKRVVIVSLIACIATAVLPVKYRKIVLNPVLISLISVLAISVQIGLAGGGYDKQILELTGMSPNALLLGRQTVWAVTLDTLEYNFWDFAFIGKGLAATSVALSESHVSSQTLLHSDVLALMLEGGWVVLIAFIYLLNSSRNLDQRAISFFLTVVLFSDNVLIYQHVMLIYLFVQYSIRREVRKIPSLKPADKNLMLSGKK